VRTFDLQQFSSWPIVAPVTKTKMADGNFFFFFIVQNYFKVVERGAALLRTKELIVTSYIALKLAPIPTVTNFTSVSHGI